MQRQFLDFWKTNVFFLNSTTPEMAIIESLKDECDLEIDLEGDPKGKTYFASLAKDKLGEILGSKEILVYQKQMLNSLSNESALKVCVKKILDKIWE